ncbi:MAG: DNA mismatch repair endonuclease MutL [Ruminococcaceae bacterium]|nr:DNA mismatch repair endonuclease MutL [Oscillospiraceae bacterium]
MPKINVLSKNVAELIAAGEVVERPASVVKELVENSIDAGACSITVEIKGGGILFLRITDNGCGIEREDVPTAFLRHATSKIKNEIDLNAIGTLGFRGEALCAVAGVSRVEMLTCTENSISGTRYVIEGGEQLAFEDAGCPKGTTIIVRDIFYNVPARMKFLKKDVTEGNAVAAIMERIALSHPEISFRFIRDSKSVFVTKGDGNLKNAVYSVLGREFASNLIEVNGETDGIKVKGLVSKPINCRTSRSGQFFFLNSRFVKSGTVTAALEQAYKNTIMVGKFPCAVLNVSVPFGSVDVNVHPAKTEVRFSDERAVFNAVYYSVKNAITFSDTRPEATFKSSAVNPFARMTAQEYKQTANVGANTKPRSFEYVPPTKKEETSFTLSDVIKAQQQTVKIEMPEIRVEGQAEAAPEPPIVLEKAEVQNTAVNKAEAPETKIAEETKSQKEVRYIGEALKTYIIAECENEVYLIDKHAAHERINYERLKSTEEIAVQALLTPVAVTLPSDDYILITENGDKISEAGFEIEDFGNNSVLVTAIPQMLTGLDVQTLVFDLAESLSETKTAVLPAQERIFHTVACKAAIKAGYNTSAYELERLASRVINDDSIMYCPHGRPVAIRLTKNEIEKQFGRIQ